MAALLSGDIPGATSRRRTRWSSTWRTASGWASTVVPPDVNRPTSISRSRRQDLFRAVGHQGLRRGGGRSDRRRPQKGGPFRDLFDFCERVDAVVVQPGGDRNADQGRRDGRFGGKRAQLLAVVDRAMQSGAAALADRRSGQKSLFGDLEPEETKPASGCPTSPNCPNASG
jgi:DNA polymerase III subunit alpha